MLLSRFYSLGRSTTKRCFPLLNQSRFVTLQPTSIIAASSNKNETFEQKNLRLNRPLSPHLTIYQPQLTTILSIFHRITGVAVTGYFVFIAATASSWFSLISFIDAINAMNLSPATLFCIKTVLAMPVSYHVANGIRHLVWDAGRNLTIKGVYTTGYVVLAATVIGSLYLASL